MSEKHRRGFLALSAVNKSGVLTGTATQKSCTGLRGLLEEKMSKRKAVSSRDSSSERRIKRRKNDAGTVTLRRSLRLKAKSAQPPAEEPTSKGSLDHLPPELIQYIFSFLSVNDLSVLAITSKVMRDAVTDWVTTFTAMCCMMSQNLNINLRHHGKSEQAQVLLKFHDLGILLKRISCLYPTKKRLQMLQDYNDKTERYRERTFNTKCSRCFSLSCTSQLLHAMTRGWEDVELALAFTSLEQHSGAQHTVRRLLDSRAGSQVSRKPETTVRAYYRKLLLETCANDQHLAAFWLTRILKQHPTAQQARILYTLYGPVRNGVVIWNQMSSQILRTEEEALRSYNELLYAFNILSLHTDEWEKDDLHILFMELTKLPETWLVENQAIFLLLSGKMASTFLTDQASSGNIWEACHLLIALGVMAYAFDYATAYTIKLLKKVLKSLPLSKERERFILYLWETIRDKLMHMWDAKENGVTEDNDMDLATAALAELGCELTKLACFDLL